MVVTKEEAERIRSSPYRRRSHKLSTNNHPPFFYKLSSSSRDHTGYCPLFSKLLSPTEKLHLVVSLTDFTLPSSSPFPRSSSFLLSLLLQAASNHRQLGSLHRGFRSKF